MAAGIRQRHRNDCNRRGKCDCTWQAEVYDAEAEEKIRKTFPTYADGAKRFKSGSVPKQQFGWFDKTSSVYKFDTRPTPVPTYAGDCAGCPSQGGAGQAGTPSATGFVAKAGGAGETTS